MTTQELAQRYKDKVTIITGGSKGIGRGCVDVFVRNGAKVIFCARNESDGFVAEAEVNNIGPGEATFVTCDVSKEEQIKNVVEQAVKKYGRIDCLINNAGQHPFHKPIDNFTADDMRNLYEINVISCFLFAKYCLPYLRKVRGNIINCSSLVEQIGQQGAVTYVATKGAITAFSKALAIDEAANNVRVNVILPGNIWTPLWETNANAMVDPEKAKSAGANSQLNGRYGTKEECGQMFLYLAAEATFCTGAVFLVTGGAELNFGYKNMTTRKDSIYE